MQALFKAEKVIKGNLVCKAITRLSSNYNYSTSMYKPLSQQYKPKGLVGLNTSDVTLSPKPTSFSAETLK